MRMKSAFAEMLLMGAMMGMGPLYPNGGPFPGRYEEYPLPCTEGQRKMFKQPVKLNKKQKAKLRSKK